MHAIALAFEILVGILLSLKSIKEMDQQYDMLLIACQTSRHSNHSSGHQALVKLLERLCGGRGRVSPGVGMLFTFCVSLLPYLRDAEEEGERG